MNGELTFKASAERDALVKFLSDKEVGFLLTYETATGLIHRNAQNSGRSLLYSAFNHLMIEKSHVWCCIPNMGYKRLTDKEVVQSGALSVTKIRRVASREIRKQNVVDYNALDNDHKTKYNVYNSQMGALKLFASRAGTGMVEQRVIAASSRIDAGDVFKLFANNKRTI